MFNQYEALKREIDALKKEVQTLKDDQIKQNRDYKDAMYNLDPDNVPELAAIVKEIRLVVKDGKVSGAFIISAINDEESGAQIIASHINLDGMTIQLNGKNGITIDSPNFKVDKQGNMKCNNAEMNSAAIKKSCVLGTDITVGAGMQLGPRYEDDNCASNATLCLLERADGASGGYSRGINISSVITRARNIAINPSDVKAIIGNVYIDPQKAGVSLEATTVESPVVKEKGFVGLERSDTATPSNDFVIAIMRVGDHALWIDKNGNLCTTANALKTGQQL